jgi:transcriptional regulator with XRE-family HTH domain
VKSRRAPIDAAIKNTAVELSTQIRRLRCLQALTQAELAQIAGVTVETVARLERVVRARSSANSNPSLETLTRVAFALGVTTGELLR